MKEGQAAVMIDQVNAIIPDLENPKGKCVIFSDPYPDGLTALGCSSKLIGEWSELLEENQHEEAAEIDRLMGDEDEED